VIEQDLVNKAAKIYEMHELGVVLNRCIIQGIDEADPKTGKVNREAMQDEIADVIAQCEINIDYFKLDAAKIIERIEMKKSLMVEWEAMFDERTARVSE